MKQVAAALDPIRLVYLVRGDATLLVERAVEALEAHILPTCGLAAFNHARLRASDPQASGAVSTARTLPMMADRRLVVLRDLHEAEDPLLELVLEYVQDPNPSTVLVLASEKLPAVRKGGTNWGVRIQNAVKKTGAVLKFESKDVSPVAFAREHAQTVGKELGRAEAELLVELIGDDLSRLAREIEKVALYVGDEPRISGAALQEVCAMLAEQVVWDLTTGIARRDPALALQCLHRLLEQDDSAGQRRRLLGLVGWQLRQILQVAGRVRAGMSDSDIRSDLRVRSDLLENVRAAVRSGMPPAAHFLTRLDAANRAMNSHRAGDRRVLEDLVVGLSTGA